MEHLRFQCLEITVDYIEMKHIIKSKKSVLIIPSPSNIYGGCTPTCFVELEVVSGSVSSIAVPIQ